MTNHNVKIRCAEIILLTDVDCYIRHHLTNGDSSQNKVKRCLSSVGDAICDGEAMIWEYKSPYKDLAEEQISSILYHEF